MIALDTNVVVRFLVADDPVQARKTKNLVARLDAEPDRAFVSDIVLCELLRVLSRNYRFTRTQVADVLT
jgi:predicted nucleic-acid-binding protein